MFTHCARLCSFRDSSFSSCRRAPPVLSRYLDDVTLRNGLIVIIPADDGQGFRSNVNTDSIGTSTGVWHVRRQNLPGAGIAVTMPLRHRGQDATNGEALGQDTRSDGRRTQRRFCEGPAARIEIRLASHLIVDSRAQPAPSAADSRPLSRMAWNRCSRSME